MILTTHALTGAITAEFVPNHPVLGFCLGFLSHFALDSIPHWDYELKSRTKASENSGKEDMVWGKAFIRDIAKIGADFSLGIILAVFFVLLFVRGMYLPALVGALGGVLPDALQFAYMKCPNKVFSWINGFHKLVHTESKLEKRYVLGIFLQVSMLAVFLLVYVFFGRIVW